MAGMVIDVTQKLATVAEHVYSVEAQWLLQTSKRALPNLPNPLQGRQRNGTWGLISCDEPQAKGPKRQREGQLFRVGQSVGRVVLDWSLSEKENLRSGRSLVDCQRWLVRCYWGRKGSSFLLVPGVGEVLWEKCPSLCK